MIEAKEKIIRHCDMLGEKVREAAVSGDIAEKIAAIADSARERSLVIPVVGAFSSGKSTLINNLLGSNVLPVDIRPETSLATELRYSLENFILAVKPNGDTDRYEVGEIKTVTDNAAKYSYAQLYIDNAKLREIEPLVLVDMPGFDSPLDLHNKAIMEYLDRGCHYMVLSSVEEGTITSSLQRRLNEIDGLGRGFSLFLSKSDLRPQESVEKLVSYYNGQLADRYGMDAKAAALSANSAEEVLACLKSINANTIFLKLYRDTLLVVCNEIIGNIGLQISSSKKDAEKLKETIAEMKAGVEKLRKKMESDIGDMRRRYSASFVNDIIAEVGRALDNSVEELVGLAISGNEDAVSRSINEIVRSALTASIREKLDGINRQIAMDFSDSLKGLDKVMKDMGLDEDYLRNLTAKVEEAIKVIGTLALDVGQTANAEGTARTGNATKARVAAAVAAKPLVSLGAKALGIGSFAVPVIGPVISVLILFLPEIIGGLAKLFGGGGGDQKEKQKEAVRSKFSGEVFPSIKRKLRDEIPGELEGHITAMIQNVQEQFELQIKNQEEAINAQVEQENTNIAERQAAQQRQEAVRSDVQKITSEIMAWGK